MTVLRLDVELPYPVELVWQALTERHLLGEWFLQTDLLPVPGGVYRAFPAPDLPGFHAPFDVDVVEVVSPHRLALRWRGEQLHADVVWELSTVAAGCRLRVGQTGFLGIAGQVRRAELQRAYAVMFEQRLPAVLARLHGERSQPTRRRRSTDVYDAADMPRRPPAMVASPAAGTTDPGFLRASEDVPAVDVLAGVDLDGPRPPGVLGRVSGMPVDRRLRLLSVAGAMVVTVLTVTAVATLVLRSPDPVAEAAGPGRGPWSGVQSGEPVAVSPQPGPSASATAAPAATPSARVASPSATAGPRPTGTAGSRQALTATYRTTDSWDGGYLGEITIRPGPAGVDGWSAVLRLPPGALVTSAWDRVDFRHAGDRVTFTPQPVHRALPAGQDFVLAFQVGDRSGAARPVSCTVNGVTCA